MGMHKIAKMPSPEELKEEMPLSEEAKQSCKRQRNP